MILNEQVIFVVGIMLIITIDFLYIGIRRYIEKNEKYSLILTIVSISKSLDKFTIKRITFGNKIK